MPRIVEESRHLSAFKGESDDIGTFLSVSSSCFVVFDVSDFSDNLGQQIYFSVCRISYMAMISKSNDKIVNIISFQMMLLIYIHNIIFT